MITQRLPQYSLPIVGQIEALQAITRKVHDPNCRLVTLVGPGGIGKTRLAVELIHRVNVDFSDGVYFVDLQSVPSPNAIPSAIASSLGYQFVKGTSQQSELIAHLYDKHILLVFDNFDHLLSGRDILKTLLDNTSQLSLLVTSREPLKLSMEQIYNIRGLAYPGVSLVSVDEINTYSAVKLFVAHAQRVCHDFSAENELSSIVEICRVTEGMPLALELAVTWLRVLSCADIVVEIRRRIDFLKSREHDFNPRHTSIEAVFDQSWNLLTEQEQFVMMGLSVFRGGFRYEAAAATTGTSLDTLAALVNKSLIRPQQNGRFRIHELQRQYASEKMNCHAGLQFEIYERYCSYFARFMDIPDSRLLGNDNTKILKRIDDDIGNIRLAWRWAVTNRRAEELHQMVHALYYYTWFRMGYAESLQALRNAANVLRACDTNRAKVVLGNVLSHLAAMYIWAGQDLNEALLLAEESVTILQSVNASNQLATATGTLGWVYFAQKQWDSAEHYLQKSVSLLKQTDQDEVQAFVIGLLSRIAFHRGQYSDAQIWNEQSLSLGIKLQDYRTITSARTALGEIMLIRGDYDTAQLHLSDALILAGEHSFEPIKIRILGVLGDVAKAKGYQADTIYYFTNSMHIAEKYDKPHPITYSLMSLANAELEQGHIVSAQNLYRRIQNRMVGCDDKHLSLLLQVGLGDFAHRLNHNAVAFQRYTTALDLSRETEHMRLETYVLTQLGILHICQDDFMVACESFSEALSKGLQQKAMPTLLYTLAAVVGFLLELDHMRDASDLALFIIGHPASSAKSKRLAQHHMSQSRHVFTDCSDVSQYKGNSNVMDIAVSLIDQLKGQITKETNRTQQLLIDALSDRELEVLYLIADGYTNREISQALTITVGTVKSHVHHILDKLDAGNRTEAVARARHIHIL